MSYMAEPLGFELSVIPLPEIHDVEERVLTMETAHTRTIRDLVYLGSSRRSRQ